MQANGFSKWAGKGQEGTPKPSSRCVHARRDGAGWFMEHCNGPHAAVCELGGGGARPPTGTSLFGSHSPILVGKYAAVSDCAVRAGPKAD